MRQRLLHPRPRWSEGAPWSAGSRGPDGYAGRSRSERSDGPRRRNGSHGSRRSDGSGRRPWPCRCNRGDGSCRPSGCGWCSRSHRTHRSCRRSRSYGSCRPSGCGWCSRTHGTHGSSGRSWCAWSHRSYRSGDGIYPGGGGTGCIRRGGYCHGVQRAAGKPACCGFVGNLIAWRRRRLCAVFSR